MPPKVKVSKDEILNAAFEITKSDGLGMVTAQSVAKRLNCSTQPIFWVFETIENLKRAVVELAEAEYDRFLLSDVPGMPKYQTTGWNYIRFAKEETQLFRLLFMSEGVEKMNIVEIDLDKHKNYVLSVIKAEYGLDGAPANELYVTMWLFCHGIAAMLATKTLDIPDDEIGKMTKNVFIGTFSRIKGEKK